MPELNDDTQNVTVYNENGNPVGIILDGSVYRFAVDAKITSGGLTATRFRPRFFTSKTDITVLTTDTLLKSISFDGQLSGISILFDSKEIDVIIEVDSTEIFRVNSEDLDDSNEYRLGIGNGGDFFPVNIQNTGKHFMLSYPDSPPDVLTNLTIKAKSTAGSAKLMKSIFVIYREKV